ncbi:ion channel domain-containing protein [Phthorimaea operculella]|nr:ion channel domain-containing protein [Phthorimaea operculella]
MDRHQPLHSSFHSSVRSRESSSTVGSDPREKIKECFRKFIAFMFTQVGVGALVVCYAILGAAGFMHIEKDSPDEMMEKVTVWRQKCAEDMWNVAKYENTDEESFKQHINARLILYQSNITAAIHAGYNGRSPEDTWSFPAALMYSLSVFTMIGYGNVIPKTMWGKIATIAYACFGIPIYILYFCNMGKVLAQTFKWLYVTTHECSRREDPLFEDGEVQPIKRKITVPSTACLWVISFYILTGTIMFGAWEKWNYLDSTYFCVISLCKIGFGDFVPGANIADSAGGSHLKLVINFIYVLLGMGLVAMCYNLMCEDVQVKVRELRQDLKNCLDDITLKITVCMNDTKYYHQKQSRHK